jgi:hypothetical protein
MNFSSSAARLCLAVFVCGGNANMCVIETFRRTGILHRLLS